MLSGEEVLTTRKVDWCLQLGEIILLVNIKSRMFMLFILLKI
jgi:hypothetical protein